MNLERIGRDTDLMKNQKIKNIINRNGNIITIPIIFYLLFVSIIVAVGPKSLIETNLNI